MKVNRLILSFIASLLLVFGQVAFADDGGTEPGAVQTAQININKADAESLQRELIGVGRSRAEAIVAYRDEFGPFYSAEELTAVRGIGMATVVKNQHKIVVE